MSCPCLSLRAPSLTWRLRLRLWTRTCLRAAAESFSFLCGSRSTGHVLGHPFFSLAWRLALRAELARQGKDSFSGIHSPGPKIASRDLGMNSQRMKDVLSTRLGSLGPRTSWGPDLICGQGHAFHLLNQEGAQAIGLTFLSTDESHVLGHPSSPKICLVPMAPELTWGP
jgi:hypothetical protein